MNFLHDIAPWLVLIAALLLFLWLDLKFFARDREPSFREAGIWSIGWLVISLVAALVVVALRDVESGVLYTTVYLVERSLSLDNLVVFLMLFAYFAVPAESRPWLLILGIAGALVLRGVFILGGITLLEQFHWVIYVLGAGLLVLAIRIFQGVDDEVDPEKNLAVRTVRRVYPVHGEFHGNRLFIVKEGKRFVTPLALALAAVIFADIAFAIDSIPAAFGITDDPLLIWMGNVFALLGLRALFVLVESLMASFRYLDETIAIVLALVALKLLLSDVVHLSPLVSLAMIAVAFAIGMLASVWANRRDERLGAEGGGRADGEPSAPGAGAGSDS
jgi:tellurite resistance protein TerC